MDERPAAWTPEQLKESVARDLEALLNTRVAVALEFFNGYPRCSVSVLNYGLMDFAGGRLSSVQERESICISMKRAIARHEPRLIPPPSQHSAAASGPRRSFRPAKGSRRWTST
jgi:type VI secretion system lysozyme-like protein